MQEETLWILLHSKAHWEMEILLQLIFDGLLGMILIPMSRYLYRRWSRHHQKDDANVAELQKEVQAIKKLLGIP